MQKNSLPQLATASATDATVQVSFAGSRPKLRLWPTVVAMKPDDAMALSIELQRAAVDARQYEYHRTSGAFNLGRADAISMMFAAV
jgi:hypothetical protein